MSFNTRANVFTCQDTLQNTLSFLPSHECVRLKRLNQNFLTSASRATAEEAHLRLPATMFQHDREAVHRYIGAIARDFPRLKSLDMSEVGILEDDTCVPGEVSRFIKRGITKEELLSLMSQADFHSLKTAGLFISAGNDDEGGGGGGGDDRWRHLRLFHNLLGHFDLARRWVDLMLPSIEILEMTHSVMVTMATAELYDVLMPLAEAPESRLDTLMLGDLCDDVGHFLPFLLALEPKMRFLHLDGMTVLDLDDDDSMPFRMHVPQGFTTWQNLQVLSLTIPWDFHHDINTFYAPNVRKLIISLTKEIFSSCSEQWEKVKRLVLDEIMDSNQVFPRLDTLYVTFDDLGAMPTAETHGEVFSDIGEFMQVRQSVDAHFTNICPREIFLQVRKSVLEESV